MLKSLNVGPRLVLGFAAALVMMVAVRAISLSRLAARKADLAAVTAEAPERLASKLRDRERYQAITLLDAVMRDDVAHKKAAFDLMKKARADDERTAAALAALLPVGNPARAAFDQTAVALLAIKAPTERAIGQSMADDLPGAAAVVREDVRPAQLAHVAALDKGVDAIQEASRRRSEGADGAYRQAVALIADLTVAAVAVGMLNAWRIQVAITRPSRQAAGVAQAVAQGDLARAITIDSMDEVGHQLQALKAVDVGLGRTVQQVRSGPKRCRRLRRRSLPATPTSASAPSNRLPACNRRRRPWSHRTPPSRATPIPRAAPPRWQARRAQPQPRAVPSGPRWSARCRRSR